MTYAEFRAPYHDNCRDIARPHCSVLLIRRRMQLYQQSYIHNRKFYHQRMPFAKNKCFTCLHACRSCLVNQYTVRFDTYLPSPEDAFSPFVALSLPVPSSFSFRFCGKCRRSTTSLILSSTSLCQYPFFHRVFGIQAELKSLFDFEFGYWPLLSSKKCTSIPSGFIDY